MNLLIIYFSFSFFILPSTTQQCEPFTFTSGLILNGEDTMRGEFPFLVALVNLVNKRFFCGANLISQRHALTAAHCLFQKYHTKAIDKEDFVALLGKYNLKNPLETDIAVKEIQEMVIHEDWKPHVWRFDADIAILIFTSEVQLSKYIKTVCLPIPSSVTDYLKEGHIVGWGVSERTGIQETEDTPRKTKMKKPPTNENCFIEYNELATLSSNRTFCAEGENSGPCLGDSGGGFFVNSNFIWTIQGIVSASLVNSHGECDVSKLSVFTNVALYIDWINHNSNGTTYSIAMDDKVNGSYHPIEMRSVFEDVIVNGTIYPIAMDDKINDSYHPIKMNCIFEDGFERECSLYIEIAADNLIFQSVTGNYRPGKDNRDVTFLEFRHPPDMRSNVKYIPSGISDVLPNLNNLVIEEAMLTKLFRRYFKGMSTVRDINLADNYIDYIEEDTFYDVPKLYQLILSGNRLTTIPSKLFLHSTELLSIVAHRNYIKEFDGEILRNCPMLQSIQLSENLLNKIQINLSNFTRIRFVDFRNNTCVDAVTAVHSKEFLSFNDLQNYIDTNC